MKVEFGDWGTSCEGSSFVLELDAIPRVGETVWIEKSMFPDHYREGCYSDDPPEELEGLVKTVVQIVEHEVTKAGHLVRCCIDV